MTVKQLINKINPILILLLVLSLVLTNPAPVSAAPLAPASQGLAVADLIKPDGSLDTSTASGLLNLAGWNVSLDANRGPVFSPAATASSYAWSALGTGTSNGVSTITVDSSGNVYAGGSFTSAGSCTDCKRIAKWDGSKWSALGKGMINDDNYVNDIAVDSSGNVYAGGYFESVTGCTGCAYIAKWNNALKKWSPLGKGLNYEVYAIAVDSSGSTVYAGGDIDYAKDCSSDCDLNHIAKWNGTTWSALGKGTSEEVFALALDSSNNLYVGGAFHTETIDSEIYPGADGCEDCNYIAKWNSTSGWSALGSGTNARVITITVNGTDVYVGGKFTEAHPKTVGGSDACTDCKYIAKYDGSSWSALGTGTDANVYAIDVSGTDVYVGGSFSSAGTCSTGCNYIAHYNGTTWSALGAGLTDAVWAIDLSGADILAGGEFLATGNSTPKTVNYIAAYAKSASIPVTVPSENGTLAAGAKTISVQFDKAVLSDDSDYAATSTKNYMLVGAGPNKTIDTPVDSTEICTSHTPVSDDVNISIDSIKYTYSIKTATLTIAPASLPLTAGSYRLYVCGAASIHDLFGNQIYDGANFALNFTASASSNPAGSSSDSGKKTVKLPATGFAPGIVSSVPAQPAALAYTKMSSLWLEIPSQQIKVDIVGVPEVSNNWDVTWLGNQAGWLNGTAYPTWLGNSVITAHVSNANGKPGPFAEIKDLQNGAKIILHLDGEKYTYEVRNSRMVFPDTTGYSFEHLEGKSYLTLITCQGYNFLADNYIFRRVVRAVLMSVTAE